MTAAVLVFRALTWLLPVPLGALAWLGWRLGASGRAGGSRGSGQRRPAPLQAG